PPAQSAPRWRLALVSVKEMGGTHSESHAAHGSASHGHDEPHEPVFVGEQLAKLEEMFPRYPNKMATLLPALWMVQEARGWVSEASMAEVAEVLGLTPAYVKGGVTFYTMYHQHPV